MSSTGIEAEFIDEGLIKVESLKDDVKACLKQFMDMVTEDKYEEELGANLMEELARKVTMMWANFDTFQLEMAAEKKACQFNPPRQPKPSPTPQNLLPYLLWDRPAQQKPWRWARRQDTSEP